MGTIAICSGLRWLGRTAILEATDGHSSGLWRKARSWHTFDAPYRFNCNYRKLTRNLRLFLRFSASLGGAILSHSAEKRCETA